jgi:hypothetical protein
MKTRRAARVVGADQVRHRVARGAVVVLAGRGGDARAALSAACWGSGGSTCVRRSLYFRPSATAG